MSLPLLSVRRPTTVMMVILAVMIMGGVSLTRLPVELYPNTSFGEISIRIGVRGQLPPEEVEQTVTRIVEEGVATVSYLKRMISISKEGESTVVLSFEPGTDMNFAALEVREKFSKVKDKLPKSIEKPIIAQYKKSDVPIMTFALTSSEKPPEVVRKIVDEWVKERFKRVAGVANVEVAGGKARKILVEFDQTKMVAYGLTQSQINSTLGSNNLNLLSGDVERTDDKILVRMIGEFQSLEEIRKIPMKVIYTGSVIKLEDVATVEDGYLEPKELARVNDEETVSIFVQKENTANTISVAKSLLYEKSLVEKDLPKDIQMVVTSDQAVFIQRAIDSLKESLMRGILLIFLVLFIFLFPMKMRYVLLVLVLIIATVCLPSKGLLVILALLTYIIFAKPRLRPVLIVVMPIPIAVISTFLFMKFMHLTLNVMTLFGLALGVGMLVDNAIVVFDNILKKREEGMGIVDGAIEGSQELLIPIIASTVTTVIVFLPMIFMSKEIQLLYSSMAITVIISLFISLICAISVVPMLSSKKMFSNSMSNLNPDKRPEITDYIMPVERKLLFRMIRHSKKVIFFACIYFLVSGYFASQMPSAYLGSTEQNRFTIFVELPSGAKLERSDEIVKQVEEICGQLQEVERVTSRVEGWSSKVYVQLVSARDRNRSTQEIIESIRPQTNRLKPAFIYFSEEDQVGTKEISVEVYGHNYKILRQLAIGMANRMETIPGLTDMKIRMKEGRPEMQIKLDKQQAATLDISTQSVADEIHGAMRGLRAMLYHEDGREIETISRMQEKFRKTFRDLYKMIVHTRAGAPFQLEQVANFRFDLGPSEIWRKDRSRMIGVSANLNDIELSEAVELVKKNLADLEFPEDYYYRIGGDYDKLIKSQKEMKMVILMVVLLVYMVLASLFESLLQPFLIMISVPLALGGAVATLYFGPRSIGIGALLGLMMLAGIVVNHSIMLMERINYYRKEVKLNPLKSVILSNKDRLRPILMTTSTTVLGLIPMAIDKGEGANLWSPLALTVIGGLMSSLVLTLAVTPSFYVASVAIGEKIKKMRKLSGSKQ